MLGHIERAKASGATLAYGGSRPAGLDRGFFVEPTLFTDVTDDMPIAREEVFGPVMAMLTWSDLDDVVARANDSDLGLTANVFTRDLRVAHRLAGQLQAGYVYVNGTGRRPPGSPFGGWKSSGLGKENSQDELPSATRKRRRSPSRCPPTSRTGPDRPLRTSMSDNLAPYDKPAWGSDVMVDVLRELDLPYIALNPGSVVPRAARLAGQLRRRRDRR